jgi:arylsulfatase A-like enzyme
MLKRLAGWLAVAFVLGLGGCGSHGRPNLLVVLVDTLRADRLGAYGSTAGLTPFLDSLAARGHVVRLAYAQSSWTAPSVASLLTSRYQSQHGVVALDSVLADAEVTLPEVLQEAGYATAGYSANAVIGPKLGYAQGFGAFRAFLVHKTAEPSYLWALERGATLNRLALGWLDALAKEPPRPWFLYLQYMEPHTPYAPPPEALARVRGGRGPVDVRRANENYFFGHLRELTPDELRDIVDVYDASVIAMDDALRDLFAELERRGRLANTVVVVTADHGDEFHEHGLMGHEKTLYNEVLHVPLIVLTPGEARGAVLDGPRELIDVAPTLLQLAGIPVPAAFAGHSFASELTGNAVAGAAAAAPPAPERAAYAELLKQPGARRWTPHVRALVRRDSKLIEGIDGERAFFALDRDPGETDPTALDPAVRADLERQIAAHRARAEHAPAPAATIPLSEDARERLRALGYTQ